ncbi:hypothetical protein CRT22_23910 [Escherichia sp. E5028]|uniref:hypothetical protein n=1 Tax=Escherichia sp. E5028 TaxID=2044602 RepID=UPI00107F511C|nr:hypothetical protein [Escherichia sp. E5028]TGB52857.1 hypothetical protein CRT22_23910 [Escherichia sp. E5028]
MYSLLLKERDYPISVYLSYMMRVRGLSRKDSIALLTHSAVKLGIRKDATPPANNTISKWGKTADVPLWAIVTACSIIEGLGKIPFTDKEWAFWSYSACERGTDIQSYAGKWREWLEKAYRYKKEYESRTEYRKRFKGLSYPDISSKIIIFYKGNNLDYINIPTLIFGLSSSRVLQPLIDNVLNSNRLFSYSDIQEAVAMDGSISELKMKIVQTVEELTNFGVITQLSDGNIVIETNF